MKSSHSRPAFTLIEIMIVVAILGLLKLALVVSMREQRFKAEDSRVKSDLARLQIALEDYYNDNNCYPPEEWFDDVNDCNSSQLSPYLDLIPCNPKTSLPYVLEKDESGCSWYRLYATLSYTNDPNIISDNYPGDYCTCSSNTTCPVPEPSTTPIQATFYYCQAYNNCTEYNPQNYTCTPSFINDPNCGSGCITPSNCTVVQP